MTKHVFSVSDGGAKPQIVSTECHITNGLPAILIVGFANKAVDEAKERIRGAFSSAKVSLPKKRITINLAPADLPKDSSGLDLAMSVAIMMESGVVNESEKNTVYIGELGLNGIIRPVRGIIGKLLGAKALGKKKFIIPSANIDQAMLVPGIEVCGYSSLSDLYRDLAQNQLTYSQTAASASYVGAEKPIYDIDMSDISGQTRAKRALEIAAAGGHNILMNGAPGTGKSMLAKCFPSILPAMNTDEILEVTQLHSLAANEYDKLVVERPFRSPHHSSSQIAIVGGGQKAKPGEISLAHNGVLFMDEFPEYNRSTLEALRQPLEDKVISISRAQHHATYPANFILIATSNPCPCGYYGTDKTCSCTPHQIVRYRQKISGPIIDRIDLYVDVDSVQHSKLLQNNGSGDTSSIIRKRVEKARTLQAHRNPKKKPLNASLSSKEIKDIMALKKDAEALLNKAAQQLDISARSYMKIIKVARTIADMAGSKNITTDHIGEAIQYRKQQADV